MLARALPLSIALAALAAASCTTVPASTPDATTLASPTSALPLADGKQLVLPAERGKVIVLGFFACWCPVSRKMLGSLGAISTPSRLDRGLVVVAVDEEDGHADAERFARAAGHTGPVGLDGEGSFIRAMKVETVPALVVVGRDGVVRRVHPGYHGQDNLTELGREIDALLAAPKPGAAPPAESAAKPGSEG